MRRGDIWSVSGGKGYAGKPRPVVVVHDEAFDATDSIIICAFTTDETDAPHFRSRLRRWLALGRARLRTVVPRQTVSPVFSCPVLRPVRIAQTRTLSSGNGARICRIG
nr:type II toxin-antitoxin system PemK/MazF family toxin [Rhizobium etli]